jgi:DNA (cytosine-5)-methyltransferase 1
VSELRVGSLFSGIGGFDLGLERTGGFRTAWFCEQDEFCQRVLARHWPGVPCHPDIAALTGDAAGPVDVLCGGFPCQDISGAGLKVGIGGSRSGLWSEYARLVRELRPRYVLVENVSALLARGLDVVLGDLAAIGYSAEWGCIRAADVGAPHLRDRLWLVGYPDHEGEPVEPVDAEARRLPKLADADTFGRNGWPRVFGPGWWRELEDCGWWQSESGVRGVADGLSGGMDGGVVMQPSTLAVGRVANRGRRCAALGNALVPQIAEWIGRRILDYEGGLT